MSNIEAAFFSLVTDKSGVLGTAIVAMILIILVLVLVVKLSKPVRWVINGFGDLFGEQARSGVPARPGVLERQAKTDADMAEIKLVLAEQSELLKELAPNHGGSIKDITAAIHKEVTQLSQRMSVVENAVGTTININNPVKEGEQQ